MFSNSKPRPSSPTTKEQHPTTRPNPFRRLAQAIGFTHLYNFSLWFIFSGALLGFALARSAYLNFYGVFCNPQSTNRLLQAGPGECYYYLNFDRYYVGIRIHLFGIIIASFLVLFQFVPAIRHKVKLFHRINGYIVVLLVLVSHAGALMIAKVAFGGSLSTQMFIGFIAILTTISLALAYINIKRLQIDQHRAWMLRSWFYLASIITERFIFPAMFGILTSMGGYYHAMPCDKIAWLLRSPTYLVQKYPTCAAFVDGTDLNAHAAVLGSMAGTGPEQAAAILNASFGASLWLALMIHAIGIEIYLQLTPGESARLKEVSYQRQLERKYKFPGDAGITAGRIGDAETYVPRDAFVQRGVSESEASVEGRKLSLGSGRHDF